MMKEVIVDISNGYIEEIATRIHDRINDMIGNHCKVLFIRMDVRFPKGYPHCGDNKEISTLMRWLKEPNTINGIKIHYVWVRERDSSECPHYHLILLVNGSMIQNPMGLLQSAERIWNGVVGVKYPGLVHLCSHGQDLGCIMIKRPSSNATGERLNYQTISFDEALAEALQRAAYLAKSHSKGNVPKRVRQYGCSRIYRKAP
jgi:hypothetical protein